MSPFVSPASPDNGSIKRTADAAERLAEATIKFNRETSKQTSKIILLTYVMLAGLILQILMAIKEDYSCISVLDNGQKYECTKFYDLGYVGRYPSPFKIYTTEPI